MVNGAVKGSNDESFSEPLPHQLFRCAHFRVDGRAAVKPSQRGGLGAADEQSALHCSREETSVDFLSWRWLNPITLEAINP